METFIFVLQAVGIALLLYMTIWFLVGTLLRRNDVADVAWGLGFILAALVPLVGLGIALDRGLFVTLLVVIWGSRLAYHIFRRNIKKPEDARYAAWRVEWGKWFLLRSYLQVFLLQGVLLMLIVMPVLLINTYRGPSSITLFDIVGILVWLTGFFFESVGDRQLRAFIANPANKGKLMTSGLWKYTRHPNYFGEVAQWWGLFIIALSVPFGIYGIIGPLTITFLILKVSGVPMLEKSMSKHPDFEAYRQKTSVFIPLPQKR